MFSYKIKDKVESALSVCKCEKFSGITNENPKTQKSCYFLIFGIKTEFSYIFHTYL